MVLTSMVSLAASSSMLMALVRVPVAADSFTAISATPSPCPAPRGGVKGASLLSSLPPMRAGGPVEDWEAEECCLKGTRGMGGSMAWLHSRNLQQC